MELEPGSRECGNEERRQIERRQRGRVGDPPVPRTRCDCKPQRTQFPRRERRLKPRSCRLVGLRIGAGLGELRQQLVGLLFFRQCLIEEFGRVAHS